MRWHFLKSRLLARREWGKGGFPVHGFPCYSVYISGHSLTRYYEIEVVSEWISIDILLVRFAPILQRRSARELRAWIKDLTSAGIDVGASRMPHEEREFDFMAKLLSSLKRDDAKSASSIPELMALLPGASDTDLEGCAGTVPVRFVGTRRDVLAPSPRGGEDVQAEFSVPRTPHIWVVSLVSVWTVPCSVSFNYARDARRKGPVVSCFFPL